MQAKLNHSSQEADALGTELEAARRVPDRRRPDTRPSPTHQFSITGHERPGPVSLHEDGRPGEVFIRIVKQGSTIHGLVDTIAVLIAGDVLCLPLIHNRVTSPIPRNPL